MRHFLARKGPSKGKKNQKGGGSRVVLHLHGFMVYLTESGVSCMLSNFVGLLDLARMLLERMWAGDRK